MTDDTNLTRPTGTRLRTHTKDGTRLSHSRGGQAAPPPVPLPPLEPGMLVKNRFLLEQKIGEGGMGVVFKARDARNERYGEQVAIKFLGAHLHGDADAWEALQHEVRKAHELAHPNIVTIYDFDQDGPLHFIYMELLEGQPLDGLLRKAAPDGLEWAEAWPIIQGAGAALAYAHEKGIIHSDFKPGNVFITHEGRVKVLDFAIARAMHGDVREFDASILQGLTLAYASPEMLTVEADPRDDVYGLACVAYELLAGRHPFSAFKDRRAPNAAYTPPAIRGLPRHKMRALLRGLAFDRAARTPSVQAFLAELEQKTTRSQIFARRAAAVGVVVVAAMGAVYWYSSAERCASVDAEFLASLSGAAPVRGTADDASYRDVLLEQGTEYLTEAEAHYDPALLSEGVSDAFGAFKNVLRIDPDSVQAKDGVMRIVGLYTQHAKTLVDAGDAKGAAAAADYGLKVHPRHCELRSLKAKALALLN